MQLGDLARDWVDRKLVGPHEVFSAVYAAWHELLPAGLAAHCELRGIEGGRVVVRVKPGSCGYELQLCKTELLEQLRAACPQAGIKEIKLTVR